MDARLPTPDRAALSRRALLLALHPEDSVSSKFLRAHADRIDWAQVLTWAEAHKVSPLLAARLAASGVGDALDSALHARLAEIRKNASERGAAAERALAYLADQYGRAGIPFFVVKGSVLAHEVYGDPSLRRFNDVDIVVRRRDVDRAEQLLREQEFRPGGLTELLGKPQPKRGPCREYAQRLARDFDAKRLCAYSWYEPARSALTPVDLHWHIAPYTVRASEDEIWQRTVTTVVAGTRVTTLEPSAALIHLALHATTCLLNGFRMLHLCDVGWAARRMVGAEDATWQLATQWGVDRHLAVVLDTLERVFEVQTTLTRADRRSVRPWERRVTSAQFLIDATENAQWTFATRALAELAWSVTMRCLRRNVLVAAAAWSARLRLRLYRWRTGT
jgi:hypothetical protein